MNEVDRLTEVEFGIPTLLLFKNGAVVDQVVGAVGKEKVASLLNGHL